MTSSLYSKVLTLNNSYLVLSLQRKIFVNEKYNYPRRSMDLKTSLSLLY